MKINIIVGSTRQARGSEKVAKWVEASAKNVENDVEFALVDLAELNLPMFDEAAPPQAQGENRQPSEAVKPWLDAMNDADGYIFVTPEYNHSIPAPLKNAIDHLDFQIKQKPSAIVSHGAIGGARANEHLRLILNSNLASVPVPESVTLKGMAAFADVILDDNTLHDDYKENQSPLDALVKSVVWYAGALKTAREN